MAMYMATITAKGQLTIPIAVRKKLGLQAGDKVLFLEDAKGIQMLKASTVVITQAEEATAKTR